MTSREIQTCQKVNELLRNKYNISPNVISLSNDNIQYIISDQICIIRKHEKNFTNANQRDIIRCSIIDALERYKYVIFIIQCQDYQDETKRKKFGFNAALIWGKANAIDKTIQQLHHRK